MKHPSPSNLAALLVCLPLLASGCSGSSPSAPEGGAADVGPSPDLAPQPDSSVADGRVQPDTVPYVPKPADIKFSAVNALPAGEQMLFNNWGTDPNVVLSMTPDGKTVTEIFRAHRVWSMGSSRAADRIAFSCGDPLQEQHYGLAMGDAIQHTWVYDVGKQTVTLLAGGNINDECHFFGPGDSALYVCRRYDFKSDGTYKGWRIGRIDLPAAGFDFLTPEVAMEFHLWPQPTPDSKWLYYGRIQISGGKQQSSVLRQALPNGTAEVVRPNAKSPTLSPDGSRYVFSDLTDQGHLYAADLDGANLLKVAEAAGTSTRYSPDGKQIAYTLWDGPLNCAHLEVVKADGSEAKAPRRLRDCGKTGEFITELDWVTRYGYAPGWVDNKRRRSSRARQRRGVAAVTADHPEEEGPSTTPCPRQRVTQGLPRAPGEATDRAVSPRRAQPAGRGLLCWSTAANID